MLKKIQAMRFDDLRRGMKVIHCNHLTGNLTQGEIKDLIPRNWDGGEDIVWIEWEHGNVHSMPIHLHFGVSVEVEG
jgi:hypothetical protein